MFFQPFPQVVCTAHVEHAVLLALQYVKVEEHNKRYLVLPAGIGVSSLGSWFALARSGSHSPSGSCPGSAVVLARRASSLRATCLRLSILTSEERGENLFSSRPSAGKI